MSSSNRQQTEECLRKLFEALTRMSKDELKCLMTTDKNLDGLAKGLKALEVLLLEANEESTIIAGEEYGENVLAFLVMLTKWETLLRKPELSCVYTIVYILSFWNPKQTKRFAELGLGSALVEILGEEVRTGRNIVKRLKNGTTITTSLMIACFFPSLSKSPCYESADSCSRCTILMCGHILETDFDIDMENVVCGQLDVALLAVDRVCWLPGAQSQHRLLLLKMIYWANALDVLEAYLDVEELAANVKEALFSRDVERITFGMATVQALMSKHLDVFRRLKFHEVVPNVRLRIALLPNNSELEWTKDICDILSSSLQKERQTVLMFAFCVREGYYLATSHLRSDLIWSMLEFILPHIADIHSEPDLDVCYSRLVKFVEVILDLPENSREKRDPLAIKTESIYTFLNMVSCVLDSFDRQMQQVSCAYEFFSELDDEYSTDLPESPEKVSLGLFRTPAFDRVLGRSKTPQVLKSNSIVQCLRLLTILYEVNENWGNLFGWFTNERLVNRLCFISPSLEICIYDKLDDHSVEPCSHISVPKHYENSVAYRYPFLFSTALRHSLLTYYLDLDIEEQDDVNIIVPRHNIMEFLEEHNVLEQISRSDFINFLFREEIGTGPGPTKEFYAKFSLECQRHDLNIWIGEPVKGHDEVVYLNPAGKLFPAPNRQPTDATLAALGGFMAKSLIDDHKLDLPISEVFYKRVFGRNGSIQLNDIRGILPNVYSLVADLAVSLREKIVIDKDERLSAEEKKEAASKITCDGSSFEDLCLNFTLPCFPEIEMKEGGRDILLTVDNLEEYLKLLLWWLVYKGPEETMKKLSSAFEKFIPLLYMNFIFADEMNSVMCGMAEEQWTVDYLKACCRLGPGLNWETRCVSDLLETLSTLSPADQRHFLRFSTSSPRLPCGGLINLDPPLTIERFDSVDRLPSSMTCFNTIFVSDCNGKEDFQARLLCAIREGSDSFDFF